MAQSDYLDFKKSALRWMNLGEYPKVLAEADYVGLRRFAAASLVAQSAAAPQQMDLLMAGGSARALPFADAATGLVIQYDGAGQISTLDLNLNNRALANSVADLHATPTQSAAAPDLLAYPLCGGGRLACDLSEAGNTGRLAAARAPPVTPTPLFVKHPSTPRTAFPNTVAFRGVRNGVGSSFWQGYAVLHRAQQRRGAQP